jgi:hypothetical protein
MPEPAVAAQTPTRPALASPPLVAIAGWLLPGAGYWLIGQRVRAIVVGVTIIVLFTSGILIGGVRSIQVPGYGENGGRLYIVREEQVDRRTGQRGVILRVAEQRAGDRQPLSDQPVVTDVQALFADVGNKPWSICQVLAGPVAIAGGTWSVWASRSPADDIRAGPPGALSHSRVNEIGVLYTAVAGMLNLLVIIDAAGRTDEAVVPAPVDKRGPMR